MEENKGGLSIFGTDFASEGLLWAGNLYQKWENICHDHIIVQDPSKFVDAVSEQFRKIYEEVADDWLNPFSEGCVKGPVSDLSLEQDVIADVCKKSKIGHKNPVKEGSLITFPSEEEKRVAPLPVIGQDEMTETCEVLDKKIAMAPDEHNRCNWSSEIQENLEIISLDFANNPGISMSEEAITFVQSAANVYEQNRVSSEPEVPFSFTKTANAKTEENEEFEDVKMEDLFEERKQVDSWEDPNKYVVHSISHQATKNRSYKKKLRDVFSTNFYCLKKKGHNHCATSYGAIDMDPVERDITAALSVSSRGSEGEDLSTTELCEPDWELL